MVLGELGSALAGALRKLGEHVVVDETVMDVCLKEVTRALLQADVNVQYVVQMKKNIVKAVSINELAAGLNARKLLEKAVFNELCQMLTGYAPGASSVPNVPKGLGDSSAGQPGQPRRNYQPVKGKTNVVMFVGLQVSISHLPHSADGLLMHITRA
jgi:signal recognition particle subunit SRP54